MITAKIERGRKTNRVHVSQRRPRKCCAGAWGDPHRPACLQFHAGRGNGKSGRFQPADRGRYGNGAGGVTVQVCAAMFKHELKQLDALAARLKLNRSNTIRIAIAALIKREGL